jgi:hypothetical protein
MDRFLEALKKLGWLGTAMVTVIAGIWIAITYFNEQRLAYSKSFSDKQLEISYLTAEAVGGLVSARTADACEENREKFWTLFYGNLVLFESDATARAMGDLGTQLDKTTFETRQALRPFALHVSKSLRDYIDQRNSNDWRLSFEKLTGF